VVRRHVLACWGGRKIGWWIICHFKPQKFTLRRCYLEMHQLSFSWGLVPDDGINYANAGNLVHSATTMGSAFPCGAQACSAWRLALWFSMPQWSACQYIADTNKRSPSWSPYRH
jgi:hypothetical protein